MGNYVLHKNSMETARPWDKRKKSRGPGPLRELLHWSDYVDEDVTRHRNARRARLARHRPAPCDDKGHPFTVADLKGNPSNKANQTRASGGLE